MTPQAPRKRPQGPPSGYHAGTHPKTRHKGNQGPAIGVLTLDPHTGGRGTPGPLPGCSHLHGGHDHMGTSPTRDHAVEHRLTITSRSIDTPPPRDGRPRRQASGRGPASPTPHPRMARPWGKGSRAACFPRWPLRWTRRVTTRGGGFAPLGRPRWTPGGRGKTRFSARFAAGGNAPVFFSSPPPSPDPSPLS